MGLSGPFIARGHTDLSRGPDWDKLLQSMEYCVIFKDCSEVPPSQELLEGCPIDNIPLAAHVPMNPEGVVPEGAFAGVPRLRHVSIESGIGLIGPEAWQSRRQLRVVKMPANNAFRNCKLLNSVTALVAGSLAAKPLRSAVLCNGCMQLKELPTSLVAPPSLGITSFEAVSTLLNLPCERFPPQASCHRKPLPATWRFHELCIPTTRHSDSLGFPFELPFVCCFYKALLSNHIVTMVGTQFTLYGVC